MADDRLKFRKLTPKGNVDLDVYNDAIDFAMHNSDLRNVAISGAYGSGKSSVLESYKNRHHEKKFIHISLSHFACGAEEALNDDDSLEEYEDSCNKKKAQSREIQLATLEGKILNQLIHQIPEEKIPQTRFKVKHNLSKRSIVSSAVMWIAAVICIAYFWRLDNLREFGKTFDVKWVKQLFNWATNSNGMLLFGATLTVLVAVGIYFLVRAQKNKSLIRKLNLQGNEIEIFEDSEESYFDKYLNEVLYLFRNSGADVVVFEDLDRYNMGLIFERLREVNTLVNAQVEPGQKPLKFFYLLRDDIFVSKDRVKFFDYIIPVVPVMDGSNSYELIVELFESAGIINSFDKNFLQGLSLYIDDMRLLQNIYNEFLVYYYRLNITEIDCNKMLAIITYKNLFPKDFCDLQLGQGFVHSLFDQKQLFVKEEVEALKQKINAFENRIAAAEAEVFKSKQELVEYFEEKKRRVYSVDREKALQQELEERKKNIELRVDSTVLSQEIEQYQNRIAELNGATLKEIITRDNIDHIFSLTSKNELGVECCFEEVKGNDYFDLLKYLIREGYIDESYNDYMTYFYEGSLSLGDKLFLRSITDKRAKPVTYKIRNPELVISRLRLADFDQIEILNYDLLNYLLTNEKLALQLKRFCTQLMETKNYAFVSGYYAQETSQRQQFVSYLNVLWPEMLREAISHQYFPSEQIHSYVVESMYYSDDHIICELNKGNCLHDYIVSADDFLEVDNPRTDKIINGLKVLDVLFPRFVSDNPNEKLLRAVYENSLYEINYDNLCYMYRRFIGQADDTDLRHRNYSLLAQEPQSQLRKYIEQHFEEYVDVILESCEEKTFDEEEVALTLINHPNVLEKQATDYIVFYQSKFSVLARIGEKTLWRVLLSNDKLAFALENINVYFSESKMYDENLIKYINSFPLDFDFSDFATVLGDDAEQFFDETVKCNELNDGIYKVMLCALGYAIDTFDVEGIEESKVIVLIDNRIIEMTKSSLSIVRKAYPDLLKRYICTNLDEYVALAQGGISDLDELLEILNWDIPENTKIELLSKTSRIIPIAEKNYSATVCAYILHNNYDTDDFEYLVENFDKFPGKVKAEIVPHAEERIWDIINNPDNVSVLLVNELLRSTEVDIDSKIELFSVFIPKMTEHEIMEMLDVLKLLKYKDIFNMNKRPTFPMDNRSEMLLTAFKTAGWITAYSESGRKPGEYKIIRQDVKRAQNGDV